MKLHLMSSAALVLLHTSNVQSEKSSSPGGLRGIFAAITDDTKFPDLSDHTAVDEQDNSGNNEFVHISGNREEKKKMQQRREHTYGKLSASTFGTSLFSRLCTNTSSGNVLLSPLSVYKALTLVKDGATVGSENESQLERVLGPPCLIEQTNEEEDGDSDVKLSMASSIWADDLKQSYVDGAIANHSADAFPLPKRYTPIDEWIEDKTNGMIKDFLGDGKIDGGTVALLVNAVYFKGSWTNAFDPEKTVDGEFTLYDESKLPARFMAASREMMLIRWSPSLGGASVAMLDYGKATCKPTEFTSLFILPRSPNEGSMNDVISGLNSQPISTLLEDARNTTVNLKLPRFRLAVGLDEPVTLKPSLENMGMKTAFDHTGGKFDEMSYNPTLFVKDVLHGAVMEVTEEGTEAAGTTKATSGWRSRTPRLTFDRPFIVAVIHRATGTPVFIGRVEEPDLLF